eukprot:SAG31_NODE_4485_length_3196_cov_1.445270_2_plen_79_part_00
MAILNLVLKSTVSGRRGQTCSGAPSRHRRLYWPCIVSWTPARDVRHRVAAMLLAKPEVPYMCICSAAALAQSQQWHLP